MRPSPLTVRSLLSAALVSALVALPAKAGIDRFTPFGPAGAGLGVTALLADPSTPGTVYASAGSDLYRSTDSGGSWTLLSPLSFARLAAAPTGGDPVLYGASASLDQIFRSSDSGRTWSPILTLPLFVGYAPLLHLEVAPSLPSRIYVAANTDIFRSDDGGDSWTRVYSGDSAIQGFVVDPLDADRLTLLNGDRLVTSADGGRTWSAGAPLVYQSYTYYPRLLAAAPSHPETLYVSGLNTVCRSDDAGATFSCQASPISPTDLLVDPADDSILYAADPRGGVSVSGDGGASWRHLRQGLPPALYGIPVNVLASDPTTGGLLVGTPDRAVQRIAGRVWQPSSGAGFLSGYVAWMQFRPGRPSEIYVQVIASSQDGGGLGILERSRDGGRTWERFGSGLGYVGNSVLGLVFEPSDPRTFYAYTAGEAFKSTDDGATWSERLSVNAFGTLVSTGKRALLAGSCGVQRSVDGGTRWREVLPCVAKSDPNLGDEIRSIAQIASSPVNPSLVYVVDFEGAYSEDPHDPSPQTPHLYRTLDGGATWRRLSLGPIRVAVAPNHPQTLYAVQGGGTLLRSDDSGGSFRPTGSLSGQISSLVVDPHDSDILYASLFSYTSHPGILRSLDGGATWRPVNAGLPRLGRLDVRAVVADPIVANRIYALPLLGGLFVEDLTAVP